MKYVIVNKLPKDCNLIADYSFPFKFTSKQLYVYEPGLDCYGDACWFRRSHNLTSDLACHLMAYAR